MKSNLDYARGLAQKAESDYRSATVLLQQEEPSLDTACFHLQQTAEKLLKTLLVIHNLDFPLTHQLEVLLSLATTVAPELEAFRERLMPFATYAVDIRYDEALCPTSKEALEALETVKQLRAAIHALLPPEVVP